MRFACPALVDAFYPAFDYDFSCKRSTLSSPILVASRARTSTHLVTSSIFLPSLPALLSPSFQVPLPRTYFSVSRAYWISRGRLSFDVHAFFESSIAQTPPGPQPASSSAVLPSPPDPALLIPNARTLLTESCSCTLGSTCARCIEPFASLRRMRSAISVYTVILSRSCPVVT
jgi:hypothetical protein